MQTCKSFFFFLNNNKQLWFELISVSIAVSICALPSNVDTGRNLIESALRKQTVVQDDF